MSLEATEPEALPEVAALPLSEPAAELGEVVLLELAVLGSLLATRAESVLVEDEDVSLAIELEESCEPDAAEDGDVPLEEPVLARLESADVRPVGERSSEDEVAPEFIEPDAEVSEELFWANEESELVEPEFAFAVLKELSRLAPLVLAVFEESLVSDVELIEPLALSEPLEDEGCE